MNELKSSGLIQEKLISIQKVNPRFSQLGTLVNASTPSVATGLAAGITEISVGQYHTCAIQNGSLNCFGRNDDGQLGDSTYIQRTASVVVSGLASGSTQVSCGGSHTISLVDGVVRAWGQNSSGQLGNDSSTNSNSAVVVEGVE